MTRSTPWPGGRWSPGEASFDTTLVRQVPVEMSDGVTLMVDVSYPAELSNGRRAAGPFPVILTQTPYLKTLPTAGDYFVERGYIFVTAYVRGTTTSGGDFQFFSQRDAEDGAELVKWAANVLEGSNGRVGLNGGSYGGITQIYTLVELGRGSPVKALAPYCMGAEFYRETYFAGGIPTQTLNFQRVIGNSMGAATAASGASFVKEVTSGGSRAYYDDFWKARTPGNLAQKIVDADVPILLWSTDGDIYAQSALELYAYLQNAAARTPTFGPMKPDQVASGRYQVIMGQGGHCESVDQRITLEWYDTWLKEADTGMADTQQPIHVHAMGSNRWINAASYPPVSTYTRCFLGPDRSLTFDVPLNSGSSSVAWGPPGGGNLLTYESEPLVDGAMLAGPISASFFASSNKEDLALIATLQVVDAVGDVLNISAGTVLASMAENDDGRSWADDAGVPIRPYGKYDRSRPIEAGSVSRYDFVLSPRFVEIAPRSRIRLLITTQTPSDKTGPNLGTDPSFPTIPQAAALAGSAVTLHHGADAPSCLNLPLLPARGIPSSDNPGIPYW